jgi:hypothetical protein
MRIVCTKYGVLWTCKNEVLCLLITDQLTLPVSGRTKISVEQLLVRASDREQSKINTILRACYLYGLFG